MKLSVQERHILSAAELWLRKGRELPAATTEVLVRALIREEAAARTLQDQTQVCICCADHRPPYLELHLHHIHPQAMGGDDHPSNLVYLCPSVHGSVHVVWRHLMKHGRLSRAEVQKLVGGRIVTGYAYKIAVDGYDAWLAETKVRSING